ncbi:MAG: hypothetical protein KAI07_00280 [Deltaproteobacteria bacterium]|nr:hypothetical protein [Deltaproteobacteria bacterium]
MKISLIRNMISRNKIIILLFVILISCDSMGDSDSGDMDDMVPDNPIIQPSPPGAPPTSPNPTPQPTEAPPIPTPLPTNAPVPTPPSGQPLNEFQSLVLDLVNDVRAQSRNCGSEFFPAAPPVNWDVRIESAALKHSQDMAQNQNFSHTGTDGSNAGDRLLMQGYNWSTWGENILVGLDDARDAVDAWIGSSGHCSIIMSPTLLEVGAGVSQGLFQSSTASYWTLVFATEN